MELELGKQEPTKQAGGQASKQKARQAGDWAGRRPGKQAGGKLNGLKWSFEASKASKSPLRPQKAS